MTLCFNSEPDARVYVTNYARRFVQRAAARGVRARLISINSNHALIRTDARSLIVHGNGNITPSSVHTDPQYYSNIHRLHAHYLGLAATHRRQRRPDAARRALVMASKDRAWAPQMP